MQHRRGKTRQVLLFVVMAAGAVIAGVHFDGWRSAGESAASAQPTQAQLDRTANERHETWFNKWRAARHPKLVSRDAPEPISPEAYAERLAKTRESRAVALALPGALDADAFAVWQARTRAKLAELLFGGALPGRGPLDVADAAPRGDLERFSREAFRKYRLKEITYRSRDDRTVRALLAVPKDAQEGERRAAVVALPGHHGHPESCFGIDALFNAPLKDPGAYVYSYGHVLANAGHVVLAPDTAYCPFIGSQDNFQAPPEGWALDGARVWDAIRAVDVLAELAQVDPGRVGAFGHSLGGEVAMHLAALDTRVRVAAICGYMQPYERSRGCRCHRVPGFEDVLRHADVFALIAPRCLLDVEGIKDLAPVARDEAIDVRFAFVVAGANDRFAQWIHDGPHMYYAGPEVLEFLDDALKKGDNRAPAAQPKE